jgi:DNA-binding winged helix-turn-helix (wHTH) protein
MRRLAGAGGLAKGGVGPAGTLQEAVLNVRFGPFVLDVDARQLTLDGRELHLSPKAFDLLVTLVQERPRVVSKAMLQQRLWPATFVAEANLSNLVAEVRGALGDSARTPDFIRTAHRFGYAFCGDASIDAGSHERAAARPVCWLEWNGRRYPLSIGEHVVGRDPDVGICLDASTVSRRHARLVVAADGVFLEDVGSKNGTFRGAERVTSPTQLADGDTIRIGSLVLTFHASGLMSTATQTRPAP